MLFLIGAAVVTGIILLCIWPIALLLRPVRAYDLDTSHVALALGRQRGSRTACWLAERQLRKEGQASRTADGLSVRAANRPALSPPRRRRG